MTSGATETHLICELDVNRICGQIDGGAMPAYIEDGVVIFGIHIGQFLGMLKFAFDDRIFEELDGIVIALECLEIEIRSTWISLHWGGRI